MKLNENEKKKYSSDERKRLKEIVLNELYANKNKAEVSRDFFINFLLKMRKEKEPFLKMANYLLEEQELFRHFTYKIFSENSNEITSLFESEEIAIEETRDIVFTYIPRVMFSTFFRSSKFENVTPLYRYLTAEEFYLLLPLAINYLEFTSVIKDDLTEAIKYFKKKEKINLNRRNYLTNIKAIVKSYFRQLSDVIEFKSNDTLQTYHIKLKKYLKQNLSDIKDYFASKRNEMSMFQVNDDNTVKLFRGYSIEESDNVILNRKDRVQDANVSMSFTPSFECAEKFASYDSKFTEMHNYDDRLNFIADILDVENIRQLKRDKKHKNVISTYRVPVENVICSYFNDDNSEVETLVLPSSDNTLTRYQFVQ